MPVPKLDSTVEQFEQYLNEALSEVARQMKPVIADSGWCGDRDENDCIEFEFSWTCPSCTKVNRHQLIADEEHEPPLFVMAACPGCKGKAKILMPWSDGSTIQ